MHASPGEAPSPPSRSIQPQREDPPSDLLCGLQEPRNFHPLGGNWNGGLRRFASQGSSISSGPVFFKTQRGLFPALSPPWPPAALRGSEPSVAAHCLLWVQQPRSWAPQMGSEVPPCALLQMGTQNPPPQHGDNRKPGRAQAASGEVPIGSVRHRPGPSVSRPGPEQGPLALCKDLA